MKRQLKTSFCLLLTILLFGFNAIAQVQKVGAIGFTVSDMDKAVQFYSEVLSFEKMSDNEYFGRAYEKLENVFGLHVRVVRMKLGDEMIELTDYLTTGGRPIPIDAKSNDLFFQHIAIVVSDMDKAYQQLKKYNVEHVSTAPQTIPPSNPVAAGVKAFYFHDPDNHNLELIYFPAGKGNPKWQETKNKLFLGIDHTAIGITSTEKSLKFYSDVLGFELKGESFNYGTEQEHLNNVEGASLHISGLRAKEGPGIEFLEYLKPGAGDGFPIGRRNDDLVNWQTTIVIGDLDTLKEPLKSKGVSFFSEEIIQLKSPNEEWIKELIVLDPDGHQLVLKEYLNKDKAKK